MLLPSIRPSTERLILVASLLAISPACTSGGESVPPKPAGSPATTTTQPVPTVEIAPPPSASVMASALVAPAPAAAAPAGAPKDLNILVVTVDSMRADMPWLGYKRDNITPVLTAFAKTAVSYSRYYAISSERKLTHPAVIAITEGARSNVFAEA